VSACVSTTIDRKCRLCAREDMQDAEVWLAGSRIPPDALTAVET
jgi:hypothetical protein